MGEDEVAGFGRPVAGKAGVEHRRVDRLAIVELSEPPAPGRGVSPLVLDHELNAVLGGSGHEGLGTAEGLVVFLRWNVAPGEPGDDRAVREGSRPVAEGLDGYVVAEDGPQIVESALLAGDGDQLPVAIAGRNLDSE